MGSPIARLRLVCIVFGWQVDLEEQLLVHYSPLQLGLFYVVPRNKDGSIKLDKKTQAMMDHYHILKDQQVYDEKLLGRPKGVLDFSDKTLSEKGYLNIGDAHDNGFIVSGTAYQGSLMLFPNQVFSWDVYNCADIRPHCFDMIEYMKPQISKFRRCKKNRICDHWIRQRGREHRPAHV